MSLSRIIKSGQPGSSVESLAFRPISRVLAAQSADETSGAFVPMGIFDQTELGGSSGSEGEQPEIVEPPSVTMIEEELQHRLRESFQNGLIEGKNLAERGLLNVYRSLRIAAEDVHALREKVMRESEEEIVELVMMVARKVILREVTQDRKILVGVVKAALAAVSERDEITVRLNPDDYILVTSSHEEYFRKELMTDKMRLKSDPTLAQGFCQIDSEMGTIDAGIDSQLNEIFRRLLDERTQATSGGA
jgi:flagellar assembly protein FliH